MEYGFYRKEGRKPKENLIVNRMCGYTYFCIISVIVFVVVVVVAVVVVAIVIIPTFVGANASSSSKRYIIVTHKNANIALLV